MGTHARKSTVAAVAVTLVLALGAAITTYDSTQGGGAGTAQAALPAGWVACANPAAGYSIAYPGSWYAAQRCTLFDPKPITLVEGTDCCPVALMVFDERERYTRVLAWITDQTFFRVLSRDEVAVAGRPVVRLEVESTGEGLYDAGTREYVYIIDRDGEGFIVETVELPGTDYGERKTVVDRAVGALAFEARNAER